MKDITITDIAKSYQKALSKVRTPYEKVTKRTPFTVPKQQPIFKAPPIRVVTRRTVYDR